MVIKDKNYIRERDLPLNIRIHISDARGLAYCNGRISNRGMNKAMEASRFMFKKFQEIDMKREYETNIIINFWINKSNIQNAKLFEF